MVLALLLFISQQWVVKDVLPPQSQVPGSELAVGGGGVCGDLDGDLCTDGYINASDLPAVADYLRLQWGPSARRSVTWEAWPTSIILGGGTVPRIALLNSPLGRLVVAGESFYYASLTSRLVRNPAVPVVISPSIMPLSFTRADDLNGDGWEELFYQNYDLIDGFSGLMDGKSLTTIWERFHPGHTYPNMLSRNEAGPLQDLDGDLIPDFISVWSNYAASTGQWSNDVMALSGRDGSLLWENGDNHSRGVYIFPVTGCDLTGDGIQDILISNAYLLKAISGADGQTLWSYDPHAALQGAASPGYTFAETMNPSVLTQVPGSFDRHFVVPARYVELTSFGDERIDLAHFDAVTGAFLGLGELPLDLNPWFSDRFQDDSGDARAFALGDQDRDGLQEIAITTNAPAYDLFPNGYTVKHLVTIGLKTLEVPPQAQIGTYFPAAVSIPSAPLYDFVWIASRGFDRRSGAVLDGWVTNLAPTSLLMSTWTSRAFAGTLDAAGRGQVQIPIPADPNLVGTRLYSRAVVLAPGGQEIWTLSTLGITDLVP